MKLLGAGVCFALALLCLVAVRSMPSNPDGGGGALMGRVVLPGLFAVAGVGLLTGKARSLQAAGVLCWLLALVGAVGEAKRGNDSGLVGETIGMYLIPVMVGLFGIWLFRNGRQR